MKKPFAAAAREIGGQPMFKLMERAQQLERAGRRILHFEIGDPDFDSPPHIVQAAVEALKAGKTHYVSSMGLLELREAICEATARQLGFRPTVEQVLIIPANAVIYAVLRCVVNPGEEVIVPDPGFSTYYSAAAFVGATVVHAPLWEAEGFRLTPETIRQRLSPRTRLIIMNSPHNPTGAVMTRQDVEQMARLAEQRDVYLVSDEVYHHVAYGTEPPASPAVADRCRERTIVLNSFSKSHAMSGWRLGYAIGPELVIDKMGLLVQTIFSCLPPFIQWAGLAALDERSAEAVRAMVAELRRRREIIVRGLNSLPGVSCLVPDGAFYAFPNIEKTGLTDRQFAERMLEEGGVALLPGSDFGEAGAGHVRLCYTTSSEVITEGIERMRVVLESAAAAKAEALAS